MAGTGRWDGIFVEFWVCFGDDFVCSRFGLPRLFRDFLKSLGFLGFSLGKMKEVCKMKLKAETLESA